ncbi:MAG: LytR family transcriptional regulator [Chlorobiota bacterium]|nr:MAG: LytR family transcriptional regulator [Chlorobiota bacterium]
MGVSRRALRTVIAGVLAAVAAVLGASFVWRMFVRPPVEPIVDVQRERAIQLRVLNGAGVPGIAQTVQQYLRRRGFDVVEIANAPSQVPRSVLYDHLGDSLAIEQVRYALDMRQEAVVRQLDSDLALHCSVVLGHDWATLRPFR